MKEKIEYINLIKSIACIGVFNSHFLGAFFVTISNIEYRDSWISYTPLAYLYMGDLCVCFFFTISGILISYAANIGNIKDLLIKIAKRVLPLIIPGTGIVLITYLAMKWNICFNNEAYYNGFASQWIGIDMNNFDINNYNVWKESLKLFTGEPQYAKHLWFISRLIKGTSICFIVNYIFHKHKYMYLFSLTYLYIFFITYDPYISMILIGALCEKLMKNLKIKSEINIKKIIIIILLIIPACFKIGGTNSIYGQIIVPILISIIVSYLKYFNYSKNNIGRMLKKIYQYSFSIYLVHVLVIITYSCWFSLFLSYNFKMDNNSIFIINYITTSLVVLLFAKTYEKFIVKKTSAVITRSYEQYKNHVIKI